MECCSKFVRTNPKAPEEEEDDDDWGLFLHSWRLCNWINAKSWMGVLCYQYVNLHSARQIIRQWNTIHKRSGEWSMNDWHYRENSRKMTRSLKSSQSHPGNQIRVGVFDPWIGGSRGNFVEHWVSSSLLLRYQTKWKTTHEDSRLRENKDALNFNQSICDLIIGQERKIRWAW